MAKDASPSRSIATPSCAGPEDGNWEPSFRSHSTSGNGESWNALSAPSGCGAVRNKGPHSSVLVYSVSSLHDLGERIIPFFRAYPLHVKRADFERFTEVVGAMLRKEHLEPVGFERIVRIAYAMNAVGKQRSRSMEEVLLGSSETIRQAPLVGDEIVRPPRRRGESGGNGLITRETGE